MTCRNQLLTQEGSIQIHQCDGCGSLSLQVHALTIRLNLGALRKLHRVIGEALRRLPEAPAVESAALSVPEHQIN